MRRSFQQARLISFLVAAAGAVHGCAPVGPNYERPETPITTTFRGQAEPEARSIAELKWWEVYKDENLQALIREHVRLAQLFASWVEEEPGWEVVAPHPLSVVCFRREGSDEENEAIRERVNRSGEAFLSGTRLNGRYVLRLAIGNARSSEDDVGRAWAALQDAARSSR